LESAIYEINLRLLKPFNTSKVAMSDNAFHSVCAKSMFPVRSTRGFDL